MKKVTQKDEVHKKKVLEVLKRKYFTLKILIIVKWRMLRIKIAVRERKELFKVFIRKLRREIMLNTIIKKNNFINGRKRFEKDMEKLILNYE